MKGLGTDIIEIDRIRSRIEEYGDRFLSKILTPEEHRYCSKYRDPSPHVAGRFAAKEAVAKALGCGFGAELEFHDIAIINQENGKPVITLSPKATLRFQNPQFLLSISHCKTHAMATVLYFI